MAEDLSETVARRLGKRRNIYRPSKEVPEAATALWRFAESAYLDNPLPFLFKERLFVYLSRFCAAKYCVARHAGNLLGLAGNSSRRSIHRQSDSEVVNLLLLPFPRSGKLEHALTSLNPIGPLSVVPKPGSVDEAGIFACAGHIYLQTPDSARCQAVLLRVFNFTLFERLSMLMAYIRAEHAWTSARDVPLEPEVERLFGSHRDLGQLIMSDFSHLVEEEEVLAPDADTEAEVDADTEPSEQEGTDEGDEEFGKEVTELRRANGMIADSRRAALNLLEDAVEARGKAEDATDALKISEEKYRGLFDSIDEGFCIVEVIFDKGGTAVDYRFLETNPAFETHTGLKGALGMTARERAPLLETYWFVIYGDIVRTGIPQRFTQRAESLERYFDVYAFRVGPQEENRVAVLFRDISERKRMEESAALLADVAAELAEMTSVAATMERLTEKIGLHFNVQQCVMAEFEDPETLIVTHGWMEDGTHTIPSPCRLREIISEEQYAECLAGEPVVVSDSQTDQRVNAGDCGALGIRSLVAMPSVRDGRAVLILSIGADEVRQWRADEVDLLKEVSSRIWASLARAHTEDALRLSEERLRLIVENARDYAIFSMDLDRTVTSWNSGAEALLGYSHDEIVGCSADLIFSSEDRMARAPQAEAEMAIHRGRASDERWHIRKNGTPFWGSGVMMAMHDADGRTVGLVKIFRDETETRAAQKALEQSKAELIEALRENEIARQEVEAASRAKDHFLAVLSHELRTPLAPVMLTTMTLQRRGDLAEPVSKGLEMIRRNVQLECHLIDDLLDLTRIARGKLEIAREPVDLHEAIRTAVDISHPDLDFKKQQLELKLDADRSIVSGDATRLQQLIWNLLKNASKFTPANGCISIATLCQGDRITVVVTDSGAGIRPERLAVIFEAFTQAEQSTFSEYGGLGLGLAIAKATVEAHQGTIEATSAGPGQGSAFFFEIPLAPVSSKT